MAKEIKKKAKKSAVPKELPFGRENMFILAIGLVILVVGYILMAQPPVDSFWSLTLAPIVLMIAYLIVIPYAIMHGHKKNKSEQ